jgi:hypothetical protein
MDTGEMIAGYACEKSNVKLSGKSAENCREEEAE